MIIPGDLNIFQLKQIFWGQICDIRDNFLSASNYKTLNFKKIK